MYWCALVFVSVPILLFFTWSNKFSCWILDKADTWWNLLANSKWQFMLELLCWMLFSRLKCQLAILQQTLSTLRTIEVTPNISAMSWRAPPPFTFASSKIQKENFLLHAKKCRKGTETKSKAHEYKIHSIRLIDISCHWA